jgi:hypothetical protein
MVDPELPHPMSLIPSLASFGPWILIGLAIVSILVAYGVYLHAPPPKRKNPESLKIPSPEAWGLLCLSAASQRRPSIGSLITRPWQSKSPHPSP